MFWDMRIIHRASPQRVQGESVPGGKLALFYTIVKDNAASRSWLSYWTDKVDDMSGLRPAGTVLPPPSPNYQYL